MQYEPIPPTDSIAQNEAPAAIPPVQYGPILLTDSRAQNEAPAAKPFPRYEPYLQRTASLSMSPYPQRPYHLYSKSPYPQRTPVH